MPVSGAADLPTRITRIPAPLLCYMDGGDVAVGLQQDPPIATQRTFDTLQTKVAKLKARHATIRQANAVLMPATLERIFSTEAPARA